MREIKFRIWDGKKKEWLSPLNEDLPAFYGFHSNGKYRLQPLNRLFNDECIIEQYTGMNDNYQKEIYEGDIVRVSVCDSTFYGAISYDAVQCMFVIDGVFLDLLQHMKCKIPCKDSRPIVMGNIHENPELLEKIK